VVNGLLSHQSADAKVVGNNLSLSVLKPSEIQRETSNNGILVTDTVVMEEEGNTLGSEHYCDMPWLPARAVMPS
jgi:hypothetical protein